MEMRLPLSFRFSFNTHFKLLSCTIHSQYFGLQLGSGVSPRETCSFLLCRANGPNFQEFSGNFPSYVTLMDTSFAFQQRRFNFFYFLHEGRGTEVRKNVVYCFLHFSPKLGQTKSKNGLTKMTVVLFSVQNELKSLFFHFLKISIRFLFFLCMTLDNPKYTKVFYINWLFQSIFIYCV